MAATGKTPILLYGSTTPTNAPTAGNLTNSSDGCEIAINVADKNLFFKDSTNAVNTVPIRQSSASSNGWLSSTDWSTFNGKQSALVSGTNIKTVSGTTLLGSGDLGTIGTAYGGTGLTGFTSANNAIYSTSSSALTAGTLPIAAGGTAQTSFTSDRIHYGSFSTSANLTTDGTNLTLGTGNLVIGTSGKGIDFSATAGTGTSELLADYEEGTWTPTYTSSGGNFSTITYSYQTGRYVKVGKYVFATGRIGTTGNPTGGSGNLRISLPFASANAGFPPGSGQVAWNSDWTTSYPTHFAINSNASLSDIIGRSTTGQTANITLSNFGGAGGNFMEFSLFYEASN